MQRSLGPSARLVKMPCLWLRGKPCSPEALRSQIKELVRFMIMAAAENCKKCQMQHLIYA